MAASSGQVTSHTKREELWLQALSRLTPEDRDQLQSLAPRNHIDVLSDLLSLTKISHQESLRKRWKYVRKNGEVVIIRDLFAKIAKWLDIFKQIGDQAVQYDSAHAALPWAGIRFVLQMAVNDINRHGRLVEVVSEISFIITRCTILENQFIPAQSRSGSGGVDTKVSPQRPNSHLLLVLVPCRLSTSAAIPSCAHRLTHVGRPSCRHPRQRLRSFRSLSSISTLWC
jgi:hypothetical protein